MAPEHDQLSRSLCMSPTSVFCQAGSTLLFLIGNAPVHFITLGGQHLPLYLWQSLDSFLTQKEHH